jgi:cobalt-precorrin 5A hydrolase
MGFGETMGGLISVGVGCRKSCASEAIVALVRRAMADCPENDGVCGLFSLVDKREEPGLNAAAQILGFNLVFLAREALAATTPRLLTRSPAAQSRFGLASVAEAAALAGAGPRARLLAPRLAADGATCAIAFVPNAESVPSP